MLCHEIFLCLTDVALPAFFFPAGALPGSAEVANWALSHAALYAMDKRSAPHKQGPCLANALLLSMKPFLELSANALDAKKTWSDMDRKLTNSVQPLFDKSRLSLCLQLSRELPIAVTLYFCHGLLSVGFLCVVYALRWRIWWPFRYLRLTGYCNSSLYFTLHDPALP